MKYQPECQSLNTSFEFPFKKRVTTVQNCEHNQQKTILKNTCLKHQRRSFKIIDYQKQLQSNAQISYRSMANPNQSKSNNRYLTRSKNFQVLKSQNAKISNESLQRFYHIEGLFKQENQNLVHQKDYLLNVIEKMKKRQAKLKLSLNIYKGQVEKLKNQNQKIKLKYSESEKQTHIISNEERKTNIDTTPSINISETIQDLNDKFDVLMFEYQKTKDPSLRKKCLEIAREIKEVKKKYCIGENTIKKR